MTEPQVWTLIGVFGTALFAILTLMSTMFVRIMRAEFAAIRSEIGSEIGSVRSEIGSVRSEIGSVRSEIEAMDTKIEAVNAKIDSVKAELTSEIRRVEGVLAARIDHLDRDVSAIIRREFPEPPAA